MIMLASYQYLKMLCFPLNPLFLTPHVSSPLRALPKPTPFRESVELAFPFLSILFFPPSLFFFRDEQAFGRSINGLAAMNVAAGRIFYFF